MGNSLQEQLMKAGLVTKTQAQQAKKQARNSRQQKRKKQPAGEKNEITQSVARAQAEKAAHDRELNRQAEAKREAKRLKAQLKQLMQENKLNDPSAEMPYNFPRGNQIKRLYVTEEQWRQLGSADLAIVGVGERHYLVPIAVSEKARTLAPNTFIYVAEQENLDEDDPYAEYKVPDDLIW